MKSMSIVHSIGELNLFVCLFGFFLSLLFPMVLDPCIPFDVNEIGSVSKRHYMQPLGTNKSGFFWPKRQFGVGFSPHS